MKRTIVSLFLVFSMSLILLSGCSADRIYAENSEEESEKTKISQETQTTVTKKEPAKETATATAESTTPGTTLATEPSMSTPESDFMTRLDAGEIIPWKSGDRLEVDYASKGEEIIEYFVTSNTDDEGNTYKLKVNNSVINQAVSEYTYYADQICYLAKVSNHIVFLIGLSDAGSGWWTDIYTYAYGELMFLGHLYYASPDDPDKIWIDSSGVLNNWNTGGQLGIANYVQGHIIADRWYDGSSNSISLLEVPAGLNPLGYYVTANTSVHVYNNRYGDSREWTIKPGEDVIFVATDVLEYVYVEKTDHSQHGWIRIDYYDDTCQVSDGTMMDIYDAFSGIQRGG